MRCCVKLCENSHFKRSGRISFHRFPQNEVQRTKWMEILKIHEIKNWSVVCSNHFEEKDFICNGTSRIFPSAMPFWREPISKPQNVVPTITEKILQLNGENFTRNIFATEMELAENQLEIQPNEIRIYDDEKTKKKMTLMRAMRLSDDEYSSSNESTETKEMKEELKHLRQYIVKSKRKIKTLCEKLRRKTKALENLKEEVSSLKNKKPGNEIALVNSEIYVPMNEALLKKEIAKVRKKRDAYRSSVKRN